MRRNMKQTNVVVTDISPLITNKIKRIKYRLVKFEDLDDPSSTYTLCIMNGHKIASRFERLPIGTKLAKVVVYTKKGQNYVDGNSNFHVMQAKPLF